MFFFIFKFLFLKAKNYNTDHCSLGESFQILRTNQAIWGKEQGLQV